jgi:hypothetical protein
MNTDKRMRTAKALSRGGAFFPGSEGILVLAFWAVGFVALLHAWWLICVGGGASVEDGAAL